MCCLSYILSTYLICLLCSLISYQQHKSLVTEFSVSSIPVNSHNLLKEFTMCGSFYMYGNIVYGTHDARSTLALGATVTGRGVGYGERLEHDGLQSPWRRDTMDRFTR